MIHSRILLDPGAGESGGGGNTFVASLPEDIRSEPSLATFKDAGSLAKSYLEANKLIGAKRIAIPGERAADAEWEAFYNSIGRPDTADKYEVPKVELEPEIQLDPAKLTVTKQALHKMGLTSKQASAVMAHYLTNLNDGVKASKGATSNAALTATNALKEAWGDQFTSNVEIARSVVKKFGGDDAAEIQKFMDDSGLGNNVKLVQLMHKIGTSILEDSGRRGGGGGGDLPINDQARAINEINNLKLDPNFTKALGDARDLGHRAAVEKWTNLHRTGYPGKSD